METKGDKKLIMVTQENNNKFYNMHDNGDDSFTVEWGRVGQPGKKTTYPIKIWDRKLREKTKKGYKDVTEIYVDSQEQEDFFDIKDHKISNLVKDLQRYANTSVSRNYTVTSEAVTEKQVEEAQTILNQLSSTKAKNEEPLNELLIELYTIIPRKMNNVKRHLFGSGYQLTLENLNRIISEEQSTLDVMRGQVNTNQKTKGADKKQTLLDAMGLSIDHANDDDLANIELLMGRNWGQFKNAFRVTNLSRREQLNEFIKNKTNKTTKLFWHGSRNENWWSILDSGLVLRPTNAIITGKMFGDGIYFADKAQKSLGYSSLRGSYWASGSDNKGYLALYEVHTGNWLHVKKHEYWMYDLTEKRLKKRGNYDSLFAEGGVDLRNNEYIIYNQKQCTIKYLIEVAI
jgi:poly [ADP-ribose] polymerase